MKETVHLNKIQIANYLRMSSPYIFVDTAEVIPGESSAGVRFFPEDEWFFRHHFIDKPVVPGVFQLEFLMQTFIMAIHTMHDVEAGVVYLREIENVIYSDVVNPNETLYAETKILSFKRGVISGNGIAYILRENEQINTCKAKFQVVSPKIMSSFTPKGIFNA